MSRDDRETRIELGAGYAPVYDDRMKAVIDHTIVPHFRAGNFADGIEAGVLEIIKRSDLGFQDPPADPLNWFSANKGLLIFGLMAGLIGFLTFSGRLQDAVQRLRRCPTCRKRTLSVQRSSAKDPDLETEGSRNAPSGAATAITVGTPATACRARGFRPVPVPSAAADRAVAAPVAAGDKPKPT